MGSQKRQPSDPGRKHVMVEVLHAPNRFASQPPCVPQVWVGVSIFKKEREEESEQNERKLKKIQRKRNPQRMRKNDRERGREKGREPERERERERRREKTI